jgi:hypothetical protein
MPGQHSDAETGPRIFYNVNFSRRLKNFCGSHSGPQEAPDTCEKKIAYMRQGLIFATPESEPNALPRVSRDWSGG